MLCATGCAAAGVRVLLVTETPPSLPSCSAAPKGACINRALQGLLRCAAVETAATVAVFGGAYAALAASGAEADHGGSQYGVAGSAGMLSAPLLLPARPHLPPVPGMNILPTTTTLTWGHVHMDRSHLEGAMQLFGCWEDPHVFG